MLTELVALSKDPFRLFTIAAFLINIRRKQKFENLKKEVGITLKVKKLVASLNHLEMLYLYMDLATCV